MVQLSDKEEEILEHLWIRTEEEGKSVNSDILPDQELRSLESRGIVEIVDQKAVLTEQGGHEARMCVRRHRLAERMLSDIMDGGEEAIQVASCKFEHGLHRGLEEKVCTMLGHPRRCPHGKPIPPGECCQRMEKEPGRLIGPLAEMETDERATIAYLHSEETSDMRKLMAIGALPGTPVIVRQRFPSYLLEMGNSQFSIDEQMARQIYVRRSGRAGRFRRRSHGRQ